MRDYLSRYLKERLSSSKERYEMFAERLRISIQFKTVHTKSALDRFDSSLPSKQRAGELEYLPWSAHKMHNTGNVGPQRYAHRQDRPFWPTHMHTCTRSASVAHRGDRHAQDIYRLAVEDLTCPWVQTARCCVVSYSQGCVLPGLIRMTCRRVCSRPSSDLFT